MEVAGTVVVGVLVLGAPMGSLGSALSCSGVRLSTSGRSAFFGPKKIRIESWFSSL